MAVDSGAGAPLGREISKPARATHAGDDQTDGGLKSGTNALPTSGLAIA
jgi:hypothetical protein